MAPRPKPRSGRVDVPWPFVDLAQRRTEYLFHHMTYGDLSMRMVLASAWMQGAADASEALEHKREREKAAQEKDNGTREAIVGTADKSEWADPIL